MLVGRVILILSFFCVSFQIFAQNLDSLINKSYGYLVTKIDSLQFERGSELNWIYLNAYLNKAKKENHLENIYYGYAAGVYQSTEDKMKYADSAVQISKMIKDPIFSGKAYELKAGVYYDFRNYDKALDNYLKSNEILTSTNDPYTKHKVLYSIGVIKFYLGQFDEAHDIFEKTKNYFIKSDDQNHRLFLLRSYYRLGELYQLTGDLKNATAVNLLGLQKANEFGEEYQKSYFNLAIGIDHFLTKDFELAITHIKKSIPQIEGLGDFDVVEKAEFYLGKSYEAIGNENEALACFVRVDSLFSKNGFLNPLARGSFERLIDYYKIQDDKDKQLYYINRLLEADRINSENTKQLAYTLKKEYDTKSLEDAKHKLEQKYSNIRYLGGALLIIFFGLLFYSFFKLYKTKKEKIRLQTLYSELLNQSDKQQNDTITEEDKIEISKKQEISEEVVNDILKRLQKFEIENEYTNPKIDLIFLSKKFKTNTTYLSKVINSQKEKNFNSYLNGLRVNYIINLLKKEPQYRHYTIQALAEICGYTNARQFSIAFYEETKLKPSYFLNQIRKEKESL